MRIYLQGASGESFWDALDDAGIEYEVPEPQRPLRESVAATNFSLDACIDIIRAHGPLLTAVAALLTAWVQLKTKRSVIIQTGDDKVVHVTGMAVDQVEHYLELAKRIDVIEARPKSPDAPKPQQKNRKR